MQDELRRADSWWLGGPGRHRLVQIIDGQQRITTLVLIAAVSQYKLWELAKGMEDGDPMKKQAREVS